jgi:hypothetical protein
MDRNRLNQMSMLRNVRGKGKGKDMTGCPLNKKNEKSRKRREVSQRNKGPPIQPEASRGDEKVKFLIVIIPTCTLYKVDVYSFVYMGDIQRRH